MADHNFASGVKNNAITAARVEFLEAVARTGTTGIESVDVRAGGRDPVK